MAGVGLGAPVVEAAWAVVPRPVEGALRSALVRTFRGGAGAAVWPPRVLRSRAAALRALLAVAARLSAGAAPVMAILTLRPHGARAMRVTVLLAVEGPALVATLPARAVLRRAGCRAIEAAGAAAGGVRAEAGTVVETASCVPLRVAGWAPAFAALWAAVRSTRMAIERASLRPALRATPRALEAALGRARAAWVAPWRLGATARGFATTPVRRSARAARALIAAAGARVGPRASARGAVVARTARRRPITPGTAFLRSIVRRAARRRAIVGGAARRRPVARRALALRAARRAVGRALRAGAVCSRIVAAAAVVPIATRPEARAVTAVVIVGPAGAGGPLVALGALRAFRFGLGHGLGRALGAVAHARPVVAGRRGARGWGLQFQGGHGARS